MDFGSSSSSHDDGSDEQHQEQNPPPPVPPPMPRRQPQQQRVFEEEMPEYRSVMIARDVAPPMPRSFISPGVKHAPPVGLRTTTTAPIKSGNGDVRPSAVNTFLVQWKSCPPTPLPRFYPLERTHVRIEDAAAGTVTNRIYETVKNMSFASGCNENEDKNVLVVETLDGVKFAIQLFEAEQTTIIVEIQRMCGCCFGFRDAAKAVLRSAQGMEPTPSPKRRPVPRSLPPRPEEAQAQCIEEDCAIARSLLVGHEDQQLLGLESLEQMTRVNNNACKLQASKSVLSAECLTHLISLLEIHSDESTTVTYVPNLSFQIRRKVLTVLANACSALSKTDLCDVLSESESDLLVSQPVVSMLLSTLKEADPKMIDAEQACRCLRALLISKDAENAMVTLHAMDAVSAALSVGCSSHSGLETESKKLLGQLRSVQ